MSEYIILKIESDNTLTLQEQGLTVEEAKEYVNGDDTLVIIEDFSS